MSDTTDRHNGELRRENELNHALRHTLALVLAGGRGSRLKGLTDRRAKPAVPFGGKFRIMDFPLSNCLNSGIRRICVLTQYKAHSLIQHVQRGWGFLRSELGEFVELWPAAQQTEKEAWYQGTADAVYQNLVTIRSYYPEYILILAGDHIYKQDYSLMLAEHIRNGADCTVACVEVPREEASAFGVVAVDENDRITGFVEKPRDPPAIPDNPNHAFASMGIYIFSADYLLDALEADARDDTSSHDFGKDLIPRMVGTDTVMAHRFSNSCVTPPHSEQVYWRDVGTLDAFWAANTDLTSVVPDLDIYDTSWPIWTHQVQRPAAKFVFDDDERRGFAVDSVVSAGCIVSGATVRRSLLFTDVRVNSWASVTDSVVMNRCDIGRGARLTKVILDSGCSIPENMVIGEDEAEDRARFDRTENGVTLVTREMLKALS